MENSKIATVPPMGPKFFGRGGHRGRGIYRPSRRGAFENGKTDTRAQLASVSGSATKQERKEYSSSTQTTATSPEHFRDRGKPELKIMPVLTYADGTMTTAPDVNGNTVPVTHCGTSTGMQTSRAERSNSLTQVQAQTQAQSSRAVRSNSLVQAQGAHTVQCSHVESLNSLAQTHGSRVEEPDSLAQTKSAHTLQSSNEHPMLNLSATVGTSVDVGAPMIQRKSAGIFNDATYRSSFEMAAPPKPSATTQHGPAYHLENRGFSAPRTTPQNDRFVNNIDTWSYPCLTPAQTLEFKTPASQSRNLFAMSVSPLDTSSRGTSTPHGVLLNTTPSRIGSQGKGTTYGFGQVPEKLRTPDSSPLAARGQLAQQLDTPHSAFRLDQADQDQEESKLKPHWVSVLVDNE